MFLEICWIEFTHWISYSGLVRPPSEAWLSISVLLIYLPQKCPKPSDRWHLPTVDIFRPSTSSDRRHLPTVNIFRPLTSSDHRHLPTVDIFRSSTSSDRWYLPIVDIFRPSTLFDRRQKMHFVRTLTLVEKIFTNGVGNSTNFLMEPSDISLRRVFDVKSDVSSKWIK